MTGGDDIVYSPRAVLSRPASFVRDAWLDLRRIPRVAWRLFRSAMQSRYRKSWLGYLWLLLPPLGTTLVWTYVQSRRIVETAPTEMPYAMHVLTGMVQWQLFVDALNAPLQQLTAAKQTITRTNVPHEAFLLAGMYETLFNCAVRILVAAPVLVFFDTPLRATLLAIPIGIAAITLFGFALGIAAVPFGLLYDDVGRALTLLSGFWLFVTPVLYPTRGWMRWNPLTPLIDTTRGWLTGGAVDPAFVPIAALSLPMLLFAWLLLRVARPHVVARLG
jgi:lipopolysaccharide transport system permease protein